MIYSIRLRLFLTMAIVVAVTAGTVAALASRISVAEFQRYVQLEAERNQLLGELFNEASTLHFRTPEEQQTAIAAMAVRMNERVLLVDAQGSVLADSAELAQQTALSDVIVGSAIVIRLSLPHEGDTVIMADPGVIPRDHVRLEQWQLPAPQPTASRLYIAPGQLLQPTVAPPGFAPTSTPIAEPSGGNLIFNTEQGAILYTIETNPGGVASTVQLGGLPVSVSWAAFAQPDPFQAGFVAGVNRSLGIALLAAALVAIALTVVLSRQIMRPVSDLTAAARRMEAGDLAVRVPTTSRDEFAQLAHAFNAMAAGIQRTETLRRTMVGDVAHELRTPLTNIRGYLEALRDGVVAPDPAMLGSLHDEALLLNRLIDDLQDLALAEAGQLRLAQRPADLAMIAAQVIAAARPRISAGQVTATLNAPPDLPTVAVDAERIGQVLRNLLNNALTHTPAGGQIQITITPDSAAQQMCITVTDTGSGIPAADLPYIFERFYRADPSRNRATGGAGIGLTIVRQLVAAHGGTVWAQSERGRGTTVGITLPMMR
jgi:signal transduction histidine kinase